MRHMNNNRSERSGIFRNNVKLWQRVLSFVTVIALVINTMYSGGLFGLFDFSAVMTVKAEGEAPAYSPTNPVSEFSSNSPAFADNEEGFRKFVDYCYYYSVDEGGTFCDSHSGDVINYNIPELPVQYGFMGLGNPDKPFAGQIKFIADNNNASSNITLPRALFTHVSTDARITDNSGKNITLEIARNSTESSPLLADHVHQGTNAADWRIKVQSTNSNTFAGVFGQIESDAIVTLQYKNESSAAVSNTASGENDIKDVGELCGIMKTGSRLTVTDNTTTRTAVSSSGGNAGSLVGTMEGNASLTLNAYPAFSSSVTSENGYAGGLVGNITSDATITFTGLSSALPVGGTVTGTAGAGGLYGHYTNSASTFDLKDYNITAAVSADNCGGVFGVLENNKGTSAVSLTIKNTGNTGVVNVRSGSTASEGHFGGIAGKYSTDDLVNSLILDAFAVGASANASLGSFGGVIGYVEGKAYIKADALQITASGTAKRDAADYFGGLIGKTDEAHGVFADIGSFTLTLSAADSSGFKGGGIVGSFTNGVLRLSGITDMSSAKSQKGGQLVGVNDNLLVYALGTGSNGTAYQSGWTFKRSNGSQVDDLGTWGEVVRGITDSSSTGTIYFDSTAHTATVAGVTASGGEYSIGTADAFTRAALNIQLNNKDGNYDCLVFTSGSADRDDLLAGKIKLSAGFSLADTGITGFMRDGSDSVGKFTGTLDGDSKTITLAIGEKYGLTSTGTTITSSTTGEGLGQIYRHPYNGLFAVIGDGTTGTGTVKSLTISGNINVRNKIDGMNIGGIAAVSNGNTTLNGITASQTVNYGEPSSVTGTKEKGKNIGGLIGLADGSDNGTIAVTGTNTISTVFNISDHFESWNSLGAFIGKVTSPKFTINIAQGSSDRLTVSHRMVDYNNFTAGGNTDGGGLIGYITSGTYSDRKVNIKNLSFSNCTIVNKASNNGGGFLGYAWLDTDTTIDGLTVTGSTITNSTPNVGVMCCEATGRWKVNSLTVTSMTMSGSTVASLGMLVNKMYTTNETTGKVNGALYLDVLNSGYTLGGSNVTLPGTITLFDELAVYSAPDVVAGGAGVISINMNSARDTGSALITTTGTYQNKLTALGSAKFKNGNARYYYNLDAMSTSNAGQNLVLWSVRKYIYSGITSALPATTLSDSNLNGTANLTGLSYYPLAKAGDYTLNGLNVTFDYNGIYETAEKTFPDGLTSDSYIRDPGATGTNKNQHYLMHGGLFIDLPAGKTINVSGSSSLGGTFLEVDGSKAALIGGTMNGNLNISGTLDLNGLIPKSTGNVLYDDGYLLINAISRPDTQLEKISLSISGLTASGYSSATLPVAKSLIGAADGREFMFDLSGIKLDGRKAAVSDGTINAAMTGAYGTSTSLFSDAILFYSINADRSSEMTYNFTYDDDWGTGSGSTAKRNVTYGNEISHTVEYWDSEGNKSRQSKYSGTRKDYTNPSGANTEYDFLTNVFLPYVHDPYDPDADHSVKYYRELKVNYLLEITSQGCGTYNDPYIIETPEQLVAIAAFINKGNTSSISLNNITLPKYDTEKHHGVALNSTGARWCTDKEGNAYHAEYTAKSGGGFKTTVEGCDDWPDDDARYYLASAYYLINNNITLGTGFDGLGGKEANYAFRGVIVGKTNLDGTPMYTITNKSENPFIYVSNGSVVKDVNIVVNFAGGIQLQQDNNSSTDAYFGYNYASSDTCKFYGGIIGEIMGGDNIIDNSYVSYSNTSITLKGTSATLTPVGGYVGAVVYGGLIFKNMDAAKTDLTNTGLRVNHIGNTYNLADNSGNEAWAAIYVNPIVGRVINGYAVNETGGRGAKKADGTLVKQFSTSEDGHYHDDDNTTRTGATEHTLKNGKKHYTIADIDPDANAYAKLDVTKVPTSGSDDGIINVPNAQALFVLSLITQSGAGTADGTSNSTLGVYNNSLSYGIYSGNVYGMSHNAEYSSVGTDDDLEYDDLETEEDESNLPDYQKFAYYDTANNVTDSTPIPYIIRHYTVGDIFTTIVPEHEEIDSISTEDYTTAGHLADLEGKEFYLKGISNYYITNTIAKTTKRDSVLKGDTNEQNAAIISVVKNGNYYNLSLKIDGETKYIVMTNYSQNQNRANLELSDDPFNYIIEFDNGYYRIKSKDTLGNGTAKYIDYDSDTKSFGGWNGKQEPNKVKFWKRNYTYKTIPEQVTTVSSFNARCVTSTAGYYNINLTGTATNEGDEIIPATYILPDSYRGLGCVGIYDSIVNAAATKTTPATYAKDNKYSMKVDKFDGKGCTIDEDIYINKFQSDNYFNVLHAGTSQLLSGDTLPFKGNSVNGGDGIVDNHGIGLFDSIIMKNSSSEIGSFVLTGSVNTEIYSNSYSANNQEMNYVDGGYTDETSMRLSLWLSVGGVCGWSTKGLNANFSNIALNYFTVSGANFVGGLLGFSGLTSATDKVVIKKCSATDISIEMTSAHQVGSLNQMRSAMGCFVGKVQEGAVIIYGTDYGANNTDLSKYSEIKIKSFGFADDDLQYYATTGGLVGYAGHCCQAYDIIVSSSSDTVTIGNSNVRFSGGIVGAMQSVSGSYSDTSAIAYFKNCTVENIDVAAEYAGGFYGGKWDSAYTPYSITLDNCKMIGKDTKNSITANRIYEKACAGGFIGRGLVKTSAAANKSNIVIRDSTVSNYNIIANESGSNLGFSGGFVGYCRSQQNNSTMTCYIHDSSIENCVIGASGSKSYGGGAVGWVNPVDATKTNKILGYNIKLDNVTAGNANNMGAWVGWLSTTDKKTAIQFTGMAIYGQGFAKNIGNWTTAQNRENTNASFVFADYGGACETYDTTNNPVSGLNCADHSSTSTTHVEMPKYPYVNVNPQSSLGTGEVISGDGAELLDSAVSGFTGTGAKTMAAKIYNECKTSGTDKQYYSTYADADDAIYNGAKINAYMNRSVDDAGDRISNYYAEKDYRTPQAYDNFACVVIANNTADETTALINRYAQLVTNTTTDYAGLDASNTYFDIVVSPCKLRNGKFEIDTSENAVAGLTYSGGQFNLNGAHADSKSVVDSFTLVDLQFKDPLDTNKIAYHLYIPVYTIKEIEVSFSAAVMNGTNSASYRNGTESNSYGVILANTGSDAHVDNLNTWFTTYIRYTYSYDDIKALLDSGNLNWNHKKFFYIDKYTASAVRMLPDTTYMILVDPNGGHDKKYQVELNSTDFAVVNDRVTLDLTKFKDSGGDNFGGSTFNELIADKLTAADAVGSGKYDLYSGNGTPSNTGTKHYVYTKAANGTPTYYEYVGSGGAYDLTLAEGPVCENYYISMYVPGAENDKYLYGYYIRTPEIFDAPIYPAGENNAVTKSAKINCVYVESGKNNTDTDNRQVFIGNVFNQVTELTVRPHDSEIDSSNHTLNIYAKTTITPKDGNVYALLKGLRPDIHHSFNVFLDRKGENGAVTNVISGLRHDLEDPEHVVTDITAWYSIDTPIPYDENADMSDFTDISPQSIELEKNYINVTTGNIFDSLLRSSSDSITIYSRIQLDFNDYESEFPQKVASDTGVSARAASNLAYDTESLAFSNMSVPIEEPASSKHIYYRQSLSTASLKYFAAEEPDCYDSDGLPSENYSRIGVNGKYSMNGYMPVDTTAQYYVQNIENSLPDAEHLILTLSLQKKTDLPVGGQFTSAEYKNVSSINDYWGAVERDDNTNEVKPNSSGEPVTDAEAGTNLRIKCGSYDGVVTVPANTTEFTVSIPKDAVGTPGYTVDANGYIYIDIGFCAKTKTGFTEYANYRVNLTVKLTDAQNGDVLGSYTDDHLIYTNAKVNHTFLKAE